MKQKLSVVFLIFCLHCGHADLLSMDSLLEKQPAILSVAPADGTRDYNSHVVEVVFSKPIDPKTITTQSFFVTAVPEGDFDLQDLLKQVSAGKTLPAEGTLEVSDEGLHARFVSLKPFPPTLRCGIFVTPQVLSLERLPLNQTPGEGPTPFFSSFYAQGNGLVADVNNAASEILPISIASRPAYLQLSEVFYDAVGSDTEGDLFVELQGEPGKNVSGYLVISLRGSDGQVMATLKIPEGMKTNPEGFFVIADAVTGQAGVTHISQADWVATFDPPNGPDCLQLVDPDGNLVDVVGYGRPLVLYGENHLLCYKGAPAPDAPSGSSLSRVAIGVDTQNNAQDWQVNNTPSPGQ